MTRPVMYYFGPWDEPGHYFFDERGVWLGLAAPPGCPWSDEVFGALQPGRVFRNGLWVQEGPEVEGQAMLHHKDGWTALAIWDRSVDRRFGSSSTYIAEGTFGFAEMMELAEARFPVRWRKMKCHVVLVGEKTV